MDRFEDGLHRGFDHDDEFSAEDLAAIREIAAMHRADQTDDADEDASPRRDGRPTTSMAAKRGNQREY